MENLWKIRFRWSFLPCGLPKDFAKFLFFLKKGSSYRQGELWKVNCNVKNGYKISLTYCFLQRILFRNIFLQILFERNKCFQNLSRFLRKQPILEYNESPLLKVLFFREVVLRSWPWKEMIFKIWSTYFPWSKQSVMIQKANWIFSIQLDDFLHFILSNSNLNIL